LYADGLTDAYGQRTDNISWALDKNVTLNPVLGSVRSNQYNIHHAFDYFKNSFEGTADDRRKNQAKLFASMGFIIHMIQDLHSPAHVRNGPHAGGDYLEIYGRYNGGFNLKNGVWNGQGIVNVGNNNPSVFDAVRNLDIKKSMLIENQYSSYQDFFTKEALWTSNNFFSEAHELTSYETVDSETGEGLEFNDDRCIDKSTTIFDARNDRLSRDQTGTRAIPNAETRFGGSYDKWFYITNPLANTSVTGIDVVAFREKGWFTDCETMTAVTDGVSSNKSYANYNKKALSDTAANVIPRAVAASQTFIDYFFRGRMEAEVNLDVVAGVKVIKDITIKNISDDALVSSIDLLTFKQDTQDIPSLSVFYLKKNDVEKKMTKLLSVSLTEDIEVDGTFKLEGLQAAINEDDTLNLDDIDKLLVLFDGEIGSIPTHSLDDYNIGARGLTAAYAKVNPIGRLNDTGITQCGDGFSNNLECPVESAPNQDAQFGRDVVLNDDSDGHAGFSFTKISSSGAELPANASSWSCVKDNVTGLIWEVKTDEFTAHAAISLFSWYDPNPATNGGNEGAKIRYDGANICHGWVNVYESEHCNTDSFIKRVNQEGFCGASDWRLPTLDEALSIIDFSGTQKSLDSNYFPSSPISISTRAYWTSTTMSYDANFAGYIYEWGGWTNSTVKTAGQTLHVRLVREGGL
jgi:hypothetical protein